MITNHLVNQINHNSLQSDNTLHVIGVISNPVRYHSRYRLYREWLAAMSLTPNVKVYTVEAALGDRHFEVTHANNPQQLQLRVKDGIWIKENMINLGIERLLPKDWKYVCWCDADVFFKDPNWAQETLHQLQHFEVVQPWRDCLDLGFYGEVLSVFKSFCYYKHSGIRIQIGPKDPYPYGHTGFAWAVTRKFWENLKGARLMDFAILGSADHHMAFALTNQVEHTVHGKMTESFKEYCKDWQYFAHRACNGQVGYVMGRIEHKFHGPKAKRGYRERWQVLIDHKYDPRVDLRYDEQGVVHIVGKPGLIHDIHHYNLSRNEDSIESVV